MSEEQSRIISESFKLASRFLRNLASIFEGNFEASQKGAKHKIKEREKQEKRMENLTQEEKDSHDQVSIAGTPKAKENKDKKKKKKSKEDKDKNGGVDQLKRPLSAYMLFNNHRRPILKKEHQSLSLPEVSKIIGDEWNKLTPEQKKTWIEKAKEQKLEYDIKNYNINQKNKDELDTIRPNPETSKKEEKKDTSAAGVIVTSVNTTASEKVVKKIPAKKEASSSLSSISDDDDVQGNLMDAISSKKKKQQKVASSESDLD